MIKYIVSWAVLVPSLCPDVKVNEYGIHSKLACTVNHLETQPKYKIFSNRDSAFTFYKNAPQWAVIDSFKLK